MLKRTGVKLQKITDMDMLIMLELGIRGGISQVSHRYKKANNPYLGLDHDEEKPTNYIMYYDAVNLYGWALSQKLPYDELEFLTDIPRSDGSSMSVCEASFHELIKYLEDQNYGDILEVDLHYPMELHDAHNEFPLAPVKAVTPESNTEKLLLTLHDKEKYVVHYRALLKYTELGLKITKIHRVIRFREKAFMADYINTNSELRRMTNSKSEKNTYKLMNNSNYGKTLENVRKRQDIELITDAKRLAKVIKQVTFKSRTIFSDNLVAVHKLKREILFDKPIYIGLAVLDLSKTLMYDVHYNVMKNRYPDDQCTLLYNDTDSLIYDIRTDDIYQDMKDFIEHFDTSCYSQDHKLYSEQNKGVVGKMKDEMSGRLITEFIALRSKCYAFLSWQGRNKQIETKKAKGVKKSVTELPLRFEDYKRILFSRPTAPPMTVSQNTLKSSGHTIFSVTTEKVALSYTDDKRVLNADGISSLAYGHYKLRTEDSVQTTTPQYSNSLLYIKSGEILIVKCAFNWLSSQVLNMVIINAVHVSIDVSDLKNFCGLILFVAFLE